VENGEWEMHKVFGRINESAMYHLYKLPYLYINTHGSICNIQAFVDQFIAYFRISDCYFLLPKTSRFRM